MCMDQHTIEDTLDLLISRGLNISSIVIKDVVLSDHCCIFFDVLISESRPVSVRKRCIKFLDTSVCGALDALTPASVHSL